MLSLLRLCFLHVLARIPLYFHVLHLSCSGSPRRRSGQG
jgi:hypothetical protein